MALSQPRLLRQPCPSEMEVIGIFILILLTAFREKKFKIISRTVLCKG